MNGAFKAACVQVSAGPDISENIAQADSFVAQAVDQGAQFVCLPENVAMMEPDRAKIVARAEKEDCHQALAAFQVTSKRHKIWLSVGSLAVSLGNGKAANRSYLINPHGEVAATYDKIHLFDVDLAGGESYRESDSFQGGEKTVTADLPWGKLGMTVCYDLRFPTLYRKLALDGADYLIVPSAFTRQTGRAHWEVLLRARAIETGCYVFASAQCGEHEGGRQTYGHSLIVSPWGDILADGGEKPGVVTAQIDPAAVTDARGKIPSLKSSANFD